MDAATTSLDSQAVHRLVSKAGDLIAIEPFGDRHASRLRAMYLEFRPRDSFQGLPPLTDAACLRWLDKLLAEGLHLVAENQDHSLVGHAAVMPIDQTRCEFLLVVAPAFQNLGIGTGLMQAAIGLARLAGFRRVWLPVERRNLRARHVYRQCGFRDRAPDGDCRHRELDMVLDLPEAPGLRATAHENGLTAG